MRVEVSFFLASRRDNKLRMQKAAIACGSAARCPDWHDHFVGDGAGYLDKLLFKAEVDRGTRRMDSRASQLSLNVKVCKQFVSPGDRVSELDLLDPRLPLGVYVGSYII